MLQLKELNVISFINIMINIINFIDRDSIWSKQNVSSKSTQTSKKKEAPSGPHSKQWDRVGQVQ